MTIYEQVDRKQLRYLSNLHGVASLQSNIHTMPRRHHGYHYISPDKRTTIVEQFLHYGWSIDFIAEINGVDARSVSKYIARVNLHNTVLSRAEIHGSRGGRPSKITLYDAKCLHDQCLSSVLTSIHSDMI